MYARDVMSEGVMSLAADATVVVDDAADPAVRAGIDAYRKKRGVSAPEKEVGARGTSWRAVKD